MRKCKLFCLPYAGGSSSIYYKWEKYLSDKIVLEPLEFPGHGEKIEQECLRSIEDIAEVLFKEISCENQLADDYAFFGHSMGTMVITELMKLIKLHGLNEPVHIFMSGRFPPHMLEKEEIHILPDDQFLEKIVEMGGIPQTIAQQKEILEFFLEPLKADYESVEKYRYNRIGKWSCPISVLLGELDQEVNDYDYMQWKDYSAVDCKFYKFNAGHFFINEFTCEIVKLIEQILLRY